jgi:mannonate dehydratase
MLIALDAAYGDDGRLLTERTVLIVSNLYAHEIHERHPGRFEWIASVHPYRRDAVEALELAALTGARAVKWIPSLMNIDPASPRCDAFYEAAARLNIPVITHAGLERAVPGTDTQDFGNPLRLRRALDAGVRVVVAHCASMGQDRDLDKGANGPYVDSFSLFARLFEDRKYEKHLFGDIAAMTQVARAGPVLAKVIEREDWHPRLLNGSDYPLPGVMPIFSVDYLVSLKLVQESAAPVLKQIRAYNPLLFDFVLKRHLRSNGKAFAKSVFETRPFFEAARQP